MVYQKESISFCFIEGGSRQLLGFSKWNGYTYEGTLI